MRRHLKLGAELLANQRSRYLVGGMFNVGVNYIIGSLIYLALLPMLNFVLVGVIATLVSISISFATYKLFVFRTKGNWWSEYLRSYVVYGSASVLNVGIMWLLLNKAHANVWVAQALVTAIAVAISYVGHTAFTFRKTKLPGATPAAR